MSHALSTDSIKAEPNLVPLLDLVFQLIMFFMICVNFVSEQTNLDIKLPVSQSARPMAKGEIDVLFLNMDPTGKILVPGQELTRVPEKRAYLRQQFADAKRLAEVRGDKTGKVNTAIIIRADQDTSYAQVFELLHICKEVGYQKLQLRAKTKSGG